MTFDWMPVIAISVAVMALVQVGTLVGLFLAMRQARSRILHMERQLEAVIDEFKPHLARVIDDARAVSAGAQALVQDIRRYVDSVEETAHSVRQRVHRVVDGVQTAASTLPVPVKVSAPAVVALWAAVRFGRSMLARLRDRRRRRERERQFSEAESYLGVG